MKSIILFFMLGWLALPAIAQSFWQRSYGGAGDDFGRAVVEVADGYIAVGSSNSFYDPSTDVYVIKVDLEGEFIWGRNFGEAGFIEWAVSAAVAPNGDIVMAGYTDNSGGNGYDGLLMRMTAEGELVWSKHYGSDDWDFFYSVSIDEAGMIYAGGETQISAHKEAWIAQMDHDGDLIWETTFPCMTRSTISGIDYCGGDTLIYSGTCYDQSNTPHMLAGTLLSDGTSIWQRSDFEFEEMNSTGCRCGNNNDLLIVANRDYPEGDEIVNSNLWMSIDLSGSEINWSHLRFSDTPKLIYDIGQKESGNVLLCGKLSGLGFAGWDAIGLEFDSVGFDIPELPKPLLGGFGEDIAYNLVPTSDNGYILVGETSSFGNNTQMLLAKIGPEGEFTDENIDHTDITTSVTFQSQERTGLKTYPNPAKDVLNVSWTPTLGTEARVEIHSLEGKSIIATDLRNGGEFRFGNLTPGIYLLMVGNDHFQTVSRVAIVRE